MRLRCEACGCELHKPPRRKSWREHYRVQPCKRCLRAAIVHQTRLKDIYRLRLSRLLMELRKLSEFYPPL